MYLVAGMSLALAIGAITAILSLVDRFRSLPVNDPERFVQIVRPTGAGMLQETFDSTIYERFQEGSRDLAELFVIGYSGDGTFFVSARQNQPEGARFSGISGGALPILGVRAIRGRILQVTGARTLAVGLDLRNRAGIDAALAEVLDALGRIDILINNVGIYPGKAFLETSKHFIWEWPILFTMSLPKAARRLTPALPRGIRITTYT